MPMLIARRVRLRWGLVLAFALASLLLAPAAANAAPATAKSNSCSADSGPVLCSVKVKCPHQFDSCTAGGQVHVEAFPTSFNLVRGTIFVNGGNEGDCGPAVETCNASSSGPTFLLPGDVAQSDCIGSATTPTGGPASVKVVCSVEVIGSPAP